MIKVISPNIVLSILASLIIPSMVMGAAIMEFFIILCCLFFFYINQKKIALNYYKNKFFAFFLCFCGFLIISSLFSENIFHSIKNTLFYFRFGVLVIVIYYLLDNITQFKYLFFWSIFLTILILCFYTYLQIFFLHNYLDPNRLSGLFGSESVQGSFLIRIAPLFLISLYYNKKVFYSKKLGFLIFPILLIIFNIIILSGERAAIFLTFLSFILYCIFTKPNLKKFLTYLIAFLFVFFLTINLYPKAKSRIINQTYNQFFFTEAGKKELQFFSEGHTQHFASAFLMFKQYFIKGVGVRNYRLECEKDHYKQVGKYHCSTHPHNTYLQILSETGVIGFLFFLTFLLFVFKKAYLYLIGIYFDNKPINIVLSLCFVNIIINFFPFTTTGSFFNNWLSTLYFLPVAFFLYEINYIKNLK